jgi:hypothetical protein
MAVSGAFGDSQAEKSRFPLLKRTQMEPLTVDFHGDSGRRIVVAVAAGDRVVLVLFLDHRLESVISVFEYLVVGVVQGVDVLGADLLE